MSLPLELKGHLSSRQADIANCRRTLWPSLETNKRNNFTSDHKIFVMRHDYAHHALTRRLQFETRLLTSH